MMERPRTPASTFPACGETSARAGPPGEGPGAAWASGSGVSPVRGASACPHPSPLPAGGERGKHGAGAAHAAGAAP